MNQNYIEYDRNGRIVSVLRLAPELYELNKDKQLMLGSADPETHYIKNGAITKRPTQLTQFNNSTLTNLPAPCTIYINGTPYECESDTAELEFDQPTTYTIRVESWPYQEWETTYENQA